MSASPLDDLHRLHRILGSHRCSCGWEGDSPTTHIIDMVGLRRWHMPDGFYEELFNDQQEQTFDWPTLYSIDPATSGADS